LWVSIAAGVASVLVMATAVVVIGELSDRDYPGIIDDDHVVDIARRECRLMTSTVEGMPLDGTPRERLAALSDQNVAVLTMVENIRRIDADERASDRPVDSWLADWESLVRARADYLERVRRGGSTDFRVPRAPDGSPITERMEIAGSDVCDVPDVLLHPRSAGSTSV
jgi:hypothetical protein